MKTHVNENHHYHRFTLLQRYWHFVRFPNLYDILSVFWHFVSSHNMWNLFDSNKNQNKKIKPWLPEKPAIRRFSDLIFYLTQIKIKNKRFLSATRIFTRYLTFQKLKHRLYFYLTQINFVLGPHQSSLLKTPFTKK